MFRSLRHYSRVLIAVALGAAVTTAVLAGALLVGDSVRGSLRDLVLDRLGEIGAVLVRDLPFRDALADDLPGAAPVLVLRGAAVHGSSGARASRVAVLGVDARFSELFPGDAALALDRAEGQIFPSVVLNAALAGELGAGVGDEILLHFNRFSEIPRASLMGETEPDDVRETVRLSVRQIVPARGPGRFGLTPRQQRPLNAFVALDRVQRALNLRGRVNALLLPDAAYADRDAAQERLETALTLEDYGIRVVRRDGHLAVESEAYVLAPRMVEAVEDVANVLGAPVLRLQSYVANRMEVGDRETPYSMVTAVDPVSGIPDSRLDLEDGSPAPTLSSEGILLNRWTAEDLEASPGDRLSMRYYVVGDREELRVEETVLTVEGVVAFEGLAADRHQAPEYPGLSDADDIASWSPPFPVDLDRIRPKDEEYWDDFGPTAKAYISAATGRRLWSTRFGDTTAIRLGPATGASLEDTEARFRNDLRATLSPREFGFRLRDVRAEGLAASAGATDFSGLFIGFSLFLIVSSALLVGLLFSLGVEQRAKEIGLLLATGFRVRAVRRRLMAEGSVVAAAGVVIGLAGAVVYAGLMIAGLRTLWLAAVGSTDLVLHVNISSLATGGLISMMVVLLAISGSVFRLSKIPPPALLAGSTEKPRKRRAGRLAPVLAHGGLAGAVVLSAYALFTGRMASPGLAFGAGALMLVAGLAYFALWCRRPRIRRAVRTLPGMAARNTAWSPGRSMLSVALVGCASFVIVVVAANRVEYGDELLDRASGTGGFALQAEADIPIHQDLNRSEGRTELGIPEDAGLGGVAVYPMRLLPGDDASCLNLYRPENPRVIGVPDDFLERGGFTFQQTLPLPEGTTSGWDLLKPEYRPELSASTDSASATRIPAVADFNSAMWILHRGLGDAIVLENEFGEPIELVLVGLLETGILQSEVMIPESDFLQHFPSRSGFGYFLIDAPRGQAVRVAETLEGTLGSFGFDATSTRDLLLAYKAVEHTYLATFQLLGGLGLLLGTVGLAIVMARNVLERRGELATLRAIGYRRTRLARMVLAENAFLLVVGVVIGTVSATLAVAPRLASLHVPWLSLAATLLAVLIVGMLASAAAVLGTMRVPLLPALKEER